MKPVITAVPARSGALLVPAAMIVANLGSYLLVLVAARRLGHAAYGELVTLLSVLLMATVPALAVQTVAARRSAVGSDRDGLLRGTAAVAGLATALMLVVSPLLIAFLHLHTPWGLLAIAATVSPLTLLGMLQGRAQGARRFPTLAALTLTAVGARSFGALVGLFLAGSPAACLAGSAVATWAAAIAAAVWLRPGRRATSAPLPDLLVETLHAAHGHAAFLLLAGADVLLARHVLDAHDAGTYAAGAVITRVALWLPQSVAVLVFATLTDSRRHRSGYAGAVAAVVAIGAVTVGAVALFGRFTVSIVSGAKYHALDHSIWVYAAIGSSLAVLQLTVVAGLALRRAGRIAIIWVVIGCAAAFVLRSHPASAADVARVLALVSAVGAAVSVALATVPRGDVVAVQPALGRGREQEA